MKYARIEDGVVAEVIDFDPTGRYPKYWVWVECPGNTAQGATYDAATGTFENPELEDPEESETEDGTPIQLSFKRFIVLVQTATGMTDEQAMDILVDSTVPSIRKLRFLMTDLDVPLERDDPIVHGGLDTLVQEGYFEEAGKAATLAAWPTE